jgi:hypothetical protein
LTQEWSERQEFVSWEARAQQERAWEEDKMDVPEELLKGIEEGWLESKLAMAATTDVEKWGGGKQRPPAKKAAETTQAVRGVKIAAATKREDGRKPKLVRKPLVLKAALVKVSQAGTLQAVQSREAMMTGQVRAAAMQAGKAALFTAETKTADGRIKGAVKRLKRSSEAVVNLTGDLGSSTGNGSNGFSRGDLTSKSTKGKAAESPEGLRRGMKDLMLSSPTKLGKERMVEKGAGKQMKLASSASSPSPLKRKLQEGVQGLGIAGFSGMGFEEEQRRMQQNEAQMVVEEKKRMYEKGLQMGKSKWVGSSTNLATRGTLMRGNAEVKGSSMMTSPLKVPQVSAKAARGDKEGVVAGKQGQRQCLHSTNTSPMVKAMSELAKAKRRIAAVEGKLEARTVEVNVMKRRMQRLEVIVDSAQAKMQGNGQGQGNLDSW